MRHQKIEKFISKEKSEEPIVKIEEVDEDDYPSGKDSTSSRNLINKNKVFESNGRSDLSDDSDFICLNDEKDGQGNNKVNFEVKNELVIKNYKPKTRSLEHIQTKENNSSKTMDLNIKEFFNKNNKAKLFKKQKIVSGRSIKNKADKEGKKSLKEQANYKEKNSTNKANYKTFEGIKQFNRRDEFKFFNGNYKKSINGTHKKFYNKNKSNSASLKGSLKYFSKGKKTERAFLNKTIKTEGRPYNFSERKIRRNKMSRDFDAMKEKEEIDNDNSI